MTGSTRDKAGGARRGWCGGLWRVEVELAWAGGTGYMDRENLVCLLRPSVYRSGSRVRESLPGKSVGGVAGRDDLSCIAAGRRRGENGPKGTTVAAACGDGMISQGVCAGGRVGRQMIARQGRREDDSAVEPDIWTVRDPGRAGWRRHGRCLSGLGLAAAAAGGDQGAARRSTRSGGCGSDFCWGRERPRR